MAFARGPFSVPRREKMQTLRALQEDGRLVLELADNGPGLSPRARENLFQPFKGSTTAGGTGLGLAIARELMRAHGGDIRLKETTAEGTCFHRAAPQAGYPRPAGEAGGVRLGWSLRPRSVTLP